MTKAMQWRIISLQVVVLIAFGFISGLLYWGGNFTTSQVRSQLSAQKIFFPPADQVKTGGALDPATFSPDIIAQAGNQVVTGDQAKIYADDFINVHLQKISPNKTYAQYGSTGLSAQDQATKATLFQGETLRGMLLNAYAWYTVGIYAIYAAMVMTVLTLVVLGTLVFEIVLAWRSREKTVPAVKAGKAFPASA